MDRAVLDAYGWTDIPTACELILDYEDPDDDAFRRKKPRRYRWPHPIRDEVLSQPPRLQLLPLLLRVPLRLCPHQKAKGAKRAPGKKRR